MSEFEREVITLYRCLSTEQKQAFNDFARLLAEMNQRTAEVSEPEGRKGSL